MEVPKRSAYEGSCPICSATAITRSLEQSEPTGRTVSIECTGPCGNYHIRESVVRELADIRRPGIRATDHDLVSHLSCHTRQRHEQKEPALVDEDWRAVAERHRALGISTSWTGLSRRQLCFMA